LTEQLNRAAPPFASCPVRAASPHLRLIDFDFHNKHCRIVRMTYRGRVKNGVIQLEPAAKLKEGTPVSIRPLKSSPRKSIRKKQIPSLYVRLKPVIGIAKGLPSDLAKNHDHYIHGAPKR